MEKRKMTNINSHLQACEMQWQSFALPVRVEIFSGYKGKTFG
jgi:hypothetical protein